MKTTYFFLVALFVCGCTTQEDNPTPYIKGKLIFEENFTSGMDNWIAEYVDNENSAVFVKDGKLVIDVDGGCSVWYKEELQGNIWIEYERTVIDSGGKNDRVSDLNQFWMTTDPNIDNLFTRSGVFHEYDSLLQYYFGIGGNTNSTTRFRKYTGDGKRVLITDLQEPEYMLKPNFTYKIITTVYEGVTKVFVNGQELFSYKDSNPLKKGYFGIRTTTTRHTVDWINIYSIK